MSDLKKEAKVENKEPKQSNLQDYLSLGYLYLLILGVINDSVRYGFLDINIINYSSVLDVLLSPFIYLTQDLKSLSILFAGGLIATGLAYGSKWYFDKNKDKESFRKKKNFASQEKLYANFEPAKIILMFLAFFILGNFLGMGIGAGKKLSKQLKAGELEVDTQLTFTNNDTLNVTVIGHNSQYFFYAEENAKKVTVMPIQGNIKKIENLE